MPQECDPLRLNTAGGACWRMRICALLGLAPHPEDLIHARHRRPVLDQQPRKQWLGDHPTARVEYFQNSGGLESASYWWPAEVQAGAGQQAAQRPRAVIVLVHSDKVHTCFDFLRQQQGAGSRPVYAGSLVAALNQSGYSVVALDQRGLGRSQGLFGACMDFQEVYVSDLQDLVSRVRASCDPAYHNLPVFLLGAGVGGLLALHSLLQQPDTFSGAVLLAPLLSVQRTAGSWLGWWWRMWLPLLDWLCPKLPLGAVAHSSSQHPQRAQCMMEDPAVYHYPTRVRNFVQYTAAARQAQAQFSSVRVPLLVFHARNDTVADVDGSRQLMAVAQSPDKTLRLLDEGGHFLWQQQDSEAVFWQAIDWLNERTAQ